MGIAFAICLHVLVIQSESSNPLNGEWHIVSVEHKGTVIPGLSDNLILTFSQRETEKAKIQWRRSSFVVKYQQKNKTSPRELDFIGEEMTSHSKGIYKIDNQMLYLNIGITRPTEFKTSSNNPTETLLIFKKKR